MNEGWLCPKCDGAHAPDVKSCPNYYYPVQFTSRCSACQVTGICTCYRPQANTTRGNVGAVR